MAVDEVTLRAATGRSHRGVWQQADGRARGVAVLFPGTRATPAHPLLYLTTKVLRTSGYDVLEVWYHYRDTDVDGLSDSELDELAAADAQAAFDEAARRGSGGRWLAAGKSLGTVHLAALWARGRLDGVPTLWLTPLLAWDAVTDALAQLTDPALVLAGSTDTATPPESLDDLDAQTDPRVAVVRIHGADHSLERSAPKDTVDALGESVDALAEFVVGLSRG